MTEVSTRLWFDEELWDAVSRRAIAEGKTVRELVPQLVAQALAPSPRSIQPLAAPVERPREAEPESNAAEPGGPPVMAMSELYICSVCGAELKLGAVSQHMNRHLKEHQAAQAVRS